MFLTWRDVHHDNQRLSGELEAARKEMNKPIIKDDGSQAVIAELRRDKALLSSHNDKLQTELTARLKSASSQSGIGKANGQNTSGTWRRLTDADRTKLSLMFSDGSRHKIRIYRTPTQDCIRLADDFYKFFE